VNFVATGRLTRLAKSRFHELERVWLSDVRTSMPFTLTHVAAILPVAWLAPGRVSLSGLAIGAMVSDIPVFFPGLLSYDATHSMVGILTHCVPIGACLFFLFHFVLKRPLIRLLPHGMSSRLRATVNLPVDIDTMSLVIMIICIAFGSLTHIVWDAFTHVGRWGVQIFPQLNELAWNLFGRPIRWFEVLQHGSSALLLPPLMIAAIQWIYRQPLPPEESPVSTKQDYWLLAIWCGLLAAMVLAGWSAHVTYPHADAVRIIRLAVSRIGGITIGVLGIYCVVMVLIELPYRRVRQ
jgi:hypothetical protein